MLDISPKNPFFFNSTIHILFLTAIFFTSISFNHAPSQATFAPHRNDFSTIDRQILHTPQFSLRISYRPWHCPVDLKEAVAAVIFASPRCSEIPELMEIRKHFAAKYRKEFTNAALEIRPDCGVSRLVIEKLSARAPDIETKIKTLKAIGEDHNIKWDSKSFEDLL